MTRRRVWMWSLAAACCWSGAVCLAEDGSTDLINDVDPPVVVEVKAAPPVEAQAIEIVVDEKSQPGAPSGVLNLKVAPPAGPAGTDAGGFLAFTSDGQLLTTVLDVDGAEAVEPGKYWIGLLCVDPGEALRAQLGLGEGVGLLVDAVTDDSPAKKAGVLQYDVLVTVNDKTDPTVRVLKQVKDLVAAVQASETKPLFLELVRKGQRQVIEVVPAERPKPTEFRDALIRDYDVRRGEQLLGLRMAGPMFAYAELRPALPEGMTMEFRQVVGQPEKITVKKGEQTWELTEGALDKAPEEVRAAVLQQLAARRAGPVPQMRSYSPSFTAFQRVMTRTNPVPVDPNARPMPPVAQAEAAARAQARAVEAKTRTDVISDANGAIQHLYVTNQSPLVVTATATTLPDDVTVTVVRKGAEPARITVKKGEQTWDVTEKELDKLPEELRKHADSALRGHAPQVWKSWTAPAGVSTPKISRITLQPPMAAGTPATGAGQYRAAVEVQKEQQRKATDAMEQAKKLLDQQREQLEIREQLQKLNDKLDKLQQALEKSAPKQ